MLIYRHFRSTIFEIFIFIIFFVENVKILVSWVILIKPVQPKTQTQQKKILQFRIRK